MEAVQFAVASEAALPSLVEVADPAASAAEHLLSAWEQVLGASVDAEELPASEELSPPLAKESGEMLDYLAQWAPDT